MSKIAPTIRVRQQGYRMETVRCPAKNLLWEDRLMSHDRETLEDRIRERAYHLWMEAGRPDGKDQEFWFMARDAETGSLTMSPDLSPAEEQLMAERERQPDMQHGLEAAAQSDGMKLKDQATTATPSTTPRMASLEGQQATDASA